MMIFCPFDYVADEILVHIAGRSEIYILVAVAVQAVIEEPVIIVPCAAYVYSISAAGHAIISEEISIIIAV